MTVADKIIATCVPSSLLLSVVDSINEPVMTLPMKVALIASALSILLILVRLIQSHYAIKKGQVELQIQQSELRMKLMQEEEQRAKGDKTKIIGN